MLINFNSILVDAIFSSYPKLLKYLLLIVIVFMPILIIKFIQFYKFERAGMREIDKMTGNEFEEYLKNYFIKLGYEVKVVGSDVGDYGADLVISKDHNLIAVQAKRHNSLIGIDAVREVFGSLNYYNCTKGIVITNNYFTNQAKILAKVNNIELWDRNVLSKNLKVLE